MAPETNRHPRADHVVLFPFMAQGHLSPFRCLAALVRRCRPDARITVVATSGTADSLRAQLDDECISVHALPFRPADASHQLIDLFLASESLRPAFHQFIVGLRRSDPQTDVHVVADMFVACTSDVARGDPGVTHSVLLTTGGYGSALYFSLWNSVPLVPNDDDDESFRLPSFPDMSVHRSQLTDHLAAADGGDAWSTFIRRQIAAFSRADALLVNTAEKLEPKGLSMLRQWLDKVPIFPVGPLLRAASWASPEKTTTNSPILAWLDKQRPGSVLYVSFGSLYTISASQATELAMGLEKSGHKFLWVVQPAADVNASESPSSGLPYGFAERMESAGRGLVARCWAPQVEVLAHPATGAFLTHCGWNSAQESLAAGVPMVGWPLSAEQFYNAKVLAEEMGVCVELARGASAAVTRDEVAGAVERVLGETSRVRAAMRRKAAEMKEVRDAARDGDGEESSVGVTRMFLDAMARTSSCSI
ncbi:Anthocyanidin 3-O-glucosyltransferase 5 [Hordeum vulgare]|uniref:Glycosyltransferase n=1 Tax=Hordeum vulgare subsp. vulgare TaxID=112509 RepID=A0A8I7B236_HORVV|nr:UDP-glycosyltransferase 92A1-like [Hordeum vulgare subsp. vulgare]KAE8777491.1 Anthocyanidin 3-O-glucosyltransferase 5 [Hordeum vulgare]